MNYNLAKTFEKMRYFVLFLILIFRLPGLERSAIKKKKKKKRKKKRRPILFLCNILKILRFQRKRRLVFIFSSNFCLNEKSFVIFFKYIKITENRLSYFGKF